jgi:CheY-like chemotaxis protein
MTSPGVGFAMLLYAAADLIWATRIKATAEDLGISARPVRSLEMLQARLADAPSDSPVRGFVADLESPVALELITYLRAPGPGQPNPVRIVAYGPHIATDRLQQAKAAGADQVLPRGAFDRQLPEILKALDQP